MDLRVQLIQEYREGESISALAEIYEVSRKTIYKWVTRHATAGVAGAIDLRRTPKQCYPCPRIKLLPMSPVWPSPTECARSSEPLPSGSVPQPENHSGSRD
jgi:hypothetical protein